MAAFEKDLIENLRGNISVSIHSETVVNLFYERTILLFCFEVAFNIPLKKNAQTWHSSNTSLDRSIDRSLRPKKRQTVNYSASSRILIRQGRRTQG